MSKPSERQKEVIRLIAKQCDYWLTSNDIGSPSHVTDIEGELANMTIDDTITDRECDAIAEAVIGVYVAVACLDLKHP